MSRGVGDSLGDSHKRRRIPGAAEAHLFSRTGRRLLRASPGTDHPRAHGEGSSCAERITYGPVFLGWAAVKLVRPGCHARTSRSGPFPRRVAPGCVSRRCTSFRTLSDPLQLSNSSTTARCRCGRSRHRVQPRRNRQLSLRAAGPPAPDRPEARSRVPCTRRCASPDGHNHRPLQKLRLLRGSRASREGVGST
jgi:hypothetical protein